MSFSKVSVVYSNNNLLKDIAAIDGVMGLLAVGTGTDAMPLLTPKPIYGLSTLKDLGIAPAPVAAVAVAPAVAATCTLNIDTLGLDTFGVALSFGGTALGSYNKTAAETTGALFAGKLKDAVNALTGGTGWSAAAAGTLITFTLPLSLTDTANGSSLTVVPTGTFAATATQIGGYAAAVVAVSASNNVTVYRHVKEYYDELAGKQLLWLMIVPETMLLAQMLDYTNANGAIKLLLAAENTIRILGVTKQPAVGYNPGVAFLDADVPNAVLKAITLCQYQLGIQGPLRVLVEGRVVAENSLNIFQPITAAAGCAGVVLGGSLPDGSASVGLALGRAAKYGCQVKLGKVANGPVNVTNIYIGTKLIKDVAGLEALHDKGYISFRKFPQKAGIYFGIDRMASNDDSRLLVYGRVLDKAAVITFATYVNELENEVDLATDGSMLPMDAKHLENVLYQQVIAQMGNQISNASVIVPLGQVIVPGNTIAVKLKIQPKGYATYINVELGLFASL